MFLANGENIIDKNKTNTILYEGFDTITATATSVDAVAKSASDEAVYQAKPS